MTGLERISAHGERPSAKQVADGKRLAASLHPDPARIDERYGAGCLVVHHAVDGLYVLTEPGAAVMDAYLATTLAGRT